MAESQELRWLRNLGAREAERFARLNRDLKKLCDCAIEVGIPVRPNRDSKDSIQEYALVTVDAERGELLINPLLLAGNPPQYVARYVIHAGMLFRAAKLEVISKDDFTLRDSQFPRRNDAVEWIRSKLDRPICA